MGETSTQYLVLSTQESRGRIVRRTEGGILKSIGRGDTVTRRKERGSVGETIGHGDITPLA